MKLCVPNNEDDVVAYIDTKGHLRIRDTGREGDELRGAICLTDDGLKNGYKFDPSKGVALFYPGDQITLRF